MTKKSWKLLAACLLGISFGFGIDAAAKNQGLSIHSKRKWSAKLTGAITDLAVSKNERAIAVVTVPDSDFLRQDKPTLFFLNQQGKKLWKMTLSSRVKEMDLSADGTRLFLTNYENQFVVIDTRVRGKVLKVSTGICRPIVQEVSKKILCYHDDDAEPGYAFDLFNWQGNKISSYPTSSDIVALKMSAHQKFLTLALTHGKVEMLDENYKAVWKKSIAGEISDLAISSENDPHIVALYRNAKKDYKIAVFDSNGKIIQEVNPTFRPIQIEISHDGKNIFYYGNSQAGQNMGSFGIGKTKESWKVGENKPTEYNHGIQVSEANVALSVEKITDQSRVGRLLVYDFHGNEKWSTDIEAKEGAYIYLYRIINKGNGAVVATDDGTIALYRR